MNLKKTKDNKDIFLHNGGCGGCVTGKYPLSKNGVVYVPDQKKILSSITNPLKFHYQFK